jgi:RNA polymerase sigma-70 factor, ECF subfamily
MTRSARNSLCHEFSSRLFWDKCSDPFSGPIQLTEPFKPHDPDPNDLQARLKNGDREALALLFSLHHNRLVRLVSFHLSRQLLGRVGPDDILQEAFLAAERRIEHYASDLSTSAFVWLRMIVMQTLTDIHRFHLNAQRRDASRELPRGFSSNPSASIAAFLTGRLTSPSQAVERAEMYELVQRTVEGMDPLDQEVLALRHFEELSNSEVAEVLGIQQKAASIRYVRAVKRLRQELSHLPGFFE